MAKKAQPGSMRSYFVSMFEEHPEWISLSSNDPIRAQFEADHGGRSMTEKEKQSMSTAKSQMRDRLGIKGKRRKKRKGKAAPSSDGVVRAALARPSVAELEELELAIDDCIDQARDVEHRRQ